ncbi:hypothetical protein HGRIS_008499 [Hohenbuehelia grisea]|uniref:Low temperature viability protein n=1 Tax=Hohenbuehelia grisea TaxID=104357 RepID=A0ABR3J8M4_9AGAR
MAPKSKSLFRQPGAQHFQLVHRSQRDPLIHDPEASQHVLKPVERENVKKGKTRTELEDQLPASVIAHDREARVGEAALYGIYFDDTEYDYMQHLRPIGVKEDGVESILIEAPSTSKGKGKQTSRDTGLSLRDLPPDVLPPTTELPRNYEAQEHIPSSISGFQPDMDPHLRQVLEALEDDAFVDDDLEEDFFGELVNEGERRYDEEVEFEFREEGVESGGEEGQNEGQNEEEQGWEARFAQFKKAQREREDDGDGSVDFASEGGDTIGRMPEFSVVGGKGKRRRKGTSDASGYSMSSSSMYRTETLQTLDEQFDQMVLKEYNEDEDDDHDDHSDISDTDSAPELITSRSDFDSMMDDFLTNYEVLGRKVKPKLEGDTGAEKLEHLRRAMGLDERVRVADGGESDDDDDAILAAFVGTTDDKKDRWDCETILTTYSNLENHPRLIRARDPKAVPRIRLDPRTGLPTVEEDSKPKPSKQKARSKLPDSESTSDEGDDHDAPLRQTVTRPRNETPEEKRARKAEVKADRQTRRADKKATKEQFANEFKSQKRTVVNKEKPKMRKL